MKVQLYLKFAYDFSRHWISQISLLMFIQGIKVLRLTDKYTERDVLNSFVDKNEKIIDKLIENGDLKQIEESNILYLENKPSFDKYPGKCILFIGGRNSIQTNIQFCERLSEYLGITIITFQYSGYYRSGSCDFLSNESYLDTINMMYKLAKSKYDVYIIGYSLGCYGSYLINEKNRVFLISPFFSLEKVVRGTVKIDNFNLGKLLEKKHIDEVLVHGFYGDFVTPIYDFTGGFKKPNVIIKYRFGNHITGLSNVLFNDIKRYVDSFKCN